MADPDPITLDDPEAYFERLADFDARHWWPRAMRAVAGGRLDAVTRGRSGLSALDVGCGTGAMLPLLAARPSVARVVGLEPSEAALRRVDSARFRVARGSALALPFSDGSFDVVTCMDVLQHLRPGGDEVAVREIARVLRADGTALVRVNSGGSTGFDRARLAGLLTGAGLVSVWISPVNCLPALAQEVRGRLSRGTRGHPEGAGLPSVTPDRLGSRLMGGIAALEALVPARLGLRLPFGHGLIGLARRV